MQWRIGAYWFVEALRLSFLVEETVLVALGDKEIKLEVTPRELHTAGDGCPLTEGDGFTLGSAIGQCITTDDILLQHVSEGEEVWLLSHLFEMPTGGVRLFHHTVRLCRHTMLQHHTARLRRLYGVNCTVCVQPLRGWVSGEDILFQSCAAGLGIVGEDVDAVAGTHGNKALELPFGLGFYIFQKGEFAAQNLNQEIAVAAGGLKEAAVEPEGLVAHQIEHRVHLAWVGEHLTMVSHPLAAFDL